VALSNACPIPLINAGIIYNAAIIPATTGPIEPTVIIKVPIPDAMPPPAVIDP